MLHPPSGLRVGRAGPPLQRPGFETGVFLPGVFFFKVRWKENALRRRCRAPGWRAGVAASERMASAGGDVHPQVDFEMPVDLEALGERMTGCHRMSLSRQNRIHDGACVPLLLL